MENFPHTQDFVRFDVSPALFVSPSEKPLRVAAQQTALRIGVPKERYDQEKRAPLTPAAVGVLVANGHQVIIERGAGEYAQFSDKNYSDAGAVIASTPEEVFTMSSVIAKITPFHEAELEYLVPNQIVISAVHLGVVQPDHLKVLMQKNITAFGFEFIQSEDGSIPFMQMMSEIAGISSVTIASELLARKRQNGLGILLGGITGVPPAAITIIGAGAVGRHAARTAIGLGATVKIIDEDVSRLRKLMDGLQAQNIYTAIAQQDYIAEAVRSADVVIGAAYRPGRRAPCVVSEQMVMEMREGSVIIDVSMDQGGCIETSRLTTHDEPTFVKHGVIHYCVPNIASRVSQTASIAISNILTPMLLKIGEAGSVQQLLTADPTFKRGLYVYHRHLTQRSIAAMFNMDYMDIDLLVVAGGM